MNALNVSEYMQTLGLQARQASARMARATAAEKSAVLRTLAKLLRSNVESLAADNAKDIERAVAAGLAAPMVDRLKLTPKIIETLAQGCEQLAAMADIFFPRVWLRRARQVPAGTVSITVYFHAGSALLAETGTGYLLGQARAQEFRNGFFDQSAQLWNEAGHLLATSHQIVYYKE